MARSHGWIGVGFESELERRWVSYLCLVPRHMRPEEPWQRRSCCLSNGGGLYICDHTPPPRFSPPPLNLLQNKRRQPIRHTELPHPRTQSFSPALVVVENAERRRSFCVPRRDSYLLHPSPLLHIHPDSKKNSSAGHSTLDYPAYRPPKLPAPVVEPNHPTPFYFPYHRENSARSRKADRARHDVRTSAQW